MIILTIAIGILVIQSATRKGPYHCQQRYTRKHGKEGVGSEGGETGVCPELPPVVTLVHPVHQNIVYVLQLFST